MWSVYLHSPRWTLISVVWVWIEHRCKSRSNRWYLAIWTFCLPSLSRPCLYWTQCWTGKPKDIGTLYEKRHRVKVALSLSMMYFSPPPPRIVNLLISNSWPRMASFKRYSSKNSLLCKKKPKKPLSGFFSLQIMCYKTLICKHESLFKCDHNYLSK